MKYKYLNLLLVAIILYVSAFAQPALKAQRAAGGTDTDNFMSMFLTKDGGLITGGFSRSNISGEKTEISRGFDDYWVVKYDSLGKIQWDKTIGGSDNDYLKAVQQTSDGGYILGGSYIFDMKIRGLKAAT